MFKKIFGFGKSKEEVKDEDLVVEDEAIAQPEPKIEFVDEDESELDEDIDENATIKLILQEESKEIVENAEDLEKIEIELEVKYEEDYEDLESIEKSAKETVVDISALTQVINTETEAELVKSEENVIFDISDCEFVKFDSDLEGEIIEEIEEPKKKISFFEKLKSGLTKTSKAITDKIDDLLTDYGKIDEDLFEELEEILITADIGMSTTMSIIEELKKELQLKKITEAAEVKQALHDVLVRILSKNNNSELISSTPSIILVIGVNGAGKTTTIGKIANQFKNEGKSVMLAAGDTFRAAAIDQLQVWGERAGVPVIAQQEGSDPAAVIFDAVQAAKSRKTDVLICDTAGRLHNKVNLMNELNKVFKVVEREFPDANKEVLLVLDATTGQNAINQAKTFSEVADVTGIVLTKLDGTAKGGVILGINSELNIPVKLIGVGEGVDDLQKFDPVSFVDALLNMQS
ncbi:MAG: signal recognition particle-docking protein FtsY [Acidaminobacteraceae bacterium]